MYEPSCDLQARVWSDSNVFFGVHVLFNTSETIQASFTVSQSKEGAKSTVAFARFQCGILSIHSTSQVSAFQFTFAISGLLGCKYFQHDIILYIKSTQEQRLINPSTYLAVYLYTHLYLDANNFRYLKCRFQGCLGGGSSLPFALLPP